jgi:hypothetical protein
LLRGHVGGEARVSELHWGGRCSWEINDVAGIFLRGFWGPNTSENCI